MTWADDLMRITGKGEEDLGKLSAAFKIDIFSEVVKRTRVDTGRLRGNWQISDSSPISGEIDRKSATPEGQVPGEQLTEIAEESTEEGKTYLVNNLPYAKVYEEKDAMVGGAVAMAEQLLKAEAKKIK